MYKYYVFEYSKYQYYEFEYIVDISIKHLWKKFSHEESCSGMLQNPFLFKAVYHHWSKEH